MRSIGCPVGANSGGERGSERSSRRADWPGARRRSEITKVGRNPGEGTVGPLAKLMTQPWAHVACKSRQWAMVPARHDVIQCRMLSTNAQLPLSLVLLFGRAI